MDNTKDISEIGEVKPAANERSFSLQIYCEMLDRMMAKDNPRRATAEAEAAKMLGAVNPDDGIEQMAAAQVLWLHGRFAALSFYASAQKTHRNVKMMNEICIQMAGALRRHMEMLMDYRDPDRRRFSVVKQANFAQQQIVTNLPPVKRKPGRPRKAIEAAGWKDGTGSGGMLAKEGGGSEISAVALPSVGGRVGRKAGAGD